MVLELDLSNPRHRELKRVMLAVHSIGEAKGALDNLKQLRGNRRRIFQPYFVTAAVVSYARPFVASRAASRIGSRWERFEEPSFVALHTRILKVRDKIVAHQDDDVNHVRIIDKGMRWTFESEDTGRKFSFVHPHMTPVVMWRDSIDDTKLFLQLCNFQAARLSVFASEMREELRPQMTNRAENELFGNW